MRISDWSSDVCSSDLHPGVKNLVFALAPAGRQARLRRPERRLRAPVAAHDRRAVLVQGPDAILDDVPVFSRSIPRPVEGNGVRGKNPLLRAEREKAET